MPVSARGAKIFFFLSLLSGGLVNAYGQSSDNASLEKALRADVEFLSDSLCAGRRTGTPGSSAGAFYIIRRLRNMGYEVSMAAFRTANDAVGHNIIASSASGGKAAILLMACYDGLGTIGGRMYPGADSNASGVAALLEIAGSLKGRKDVIIAFVDAHNANMAGAGALKDYLGRRPLRMVVNFDILGSTMAPPDKFWKNYLIILGGAPYQRSFDRLNAGKALHLYYNYYNSRSFTELFYRKVSDHKVFFDKGIPILMFTSGITMNTNRESDAFDTLDYEVFAHRVDLIVRWLETL